MLFLPVNGLIHLVDYQEQLFRANMLFKEFLRKKNEALRYSIQRQWFCAVHDEGEEKKSKMS